MKRLYMITVTLHINDVVQTLVLKPRRTLLDALRHDLQLTGTKKVSECYRWPISTPGRKKGGARRRS